ncbi:MAG: tRNA-intron lyase [Desulfurococcales archaeon]|nr:tRNA-intron lyase [Desulfurococcales archaeon]
MEELNGEIRGLLIQGEVVIPSIDDSRKIYSLGFYGKPIGIDKPRGANFDVPLKLSLIEALYLLEKGIIKISTIEGSEVSVDELKKVMEESKRFKMLYKVYRDLRDRGLVVRPGLKFGADFTVYREGPGLEHAPFIVHVYPFDSEIDPTELVRAGRLSHSVRKTFILATSTPSGKIQYITFKWYKP